MVAPLVPPPSATRQLDHWSIGPAPAMTADPVIVPTMQLGSLDRPPFRSSGRRFFGAGLVTTGVNGGMVSLRVASRRLAAVVDQLLLTTTTTADVFVMFDIDPFLFGGGVPVFVPEAGTRGLSANEIGISVDQGIVGQNLLIRVSLEPGAPLIIPTEITLQLPRAESGLATWANLHVMASAQGVSLRVGFSGRLWYFEE